MAAFQKRGQTWTYRIDTKDELGKRKQVTKGGFKTLKEAKEAARIIELKISNGEVIEKKDGTVNEFFNEFIETYMKYNYRDSTYKIRKQIIFSRILPTFGEIKISDLKSIKIQKMYNDFFDSGLSPGYINTIHRLLKTAFKYAMKWNYIKSNPMDDVKPLKTVKKTVKTWTIDQVKDFIKNTSHCHFQIFFLIAIYTGMRRSEIINLKWNQIDFKNKTISVTGLTKTKSSQRILTISDFLIKKLKEHRIKQIENKLKIGQNYNDFDFVISTALGSQVSPRNITRAFNDYLKYCPDLPVIRLHDLRHTHATILLTLGENPKIVSERLGHSKVNITLDTYSHVLPNLQKQTAIKFNDALN